MTAPSPKGVRSPAVAGLFYPERPDACRQMATQLLGDAPRHPQEAPGGLGGLVPHAGWVCSGEVAAETIVHLAAGFTPDLIVVFGAVHTAACASQAALDSHAAWSLPTGQIILPHHVQAELAADREHFVVDGRLHAREHAVEVQIPLLQLIWPAVTILPVEVPPDAMAEQIGRKTAQIVSRLASRPVFLASSDLTHYGATYGLLPVGTGPKAMQWGKDNDQRLLDLLCQMKPNALVGESESHLNACGAGAIAAMVAACMERGAKTVRILRHTSSFETLARISPQAGDLSVGYASAVVQ